MHNNSGQLGKRELHLIVGRAGTGKTELLRQQWRQSDRCLALDVLCQFPEGIIISDYQECLNYFGQGTGKRRCAPENFKVIFRPRLDLAEKQSLYEAADWICLVSRAVGPCELYLDEIDGYCSSTDLPQNLDLLIRYGRHAGITVRAAVRRPRVVIPRHYVTEANRISVFRTVDPQDCAFLASYMGEDMAVGNMRFPVTEVLQDLDQFQFVDWIEGDLSIKKLTLPGKNDATL